MTTGGYASQSRRADLPQAALVGSLAKLTWNITGERMTAIGRKQTLGAAPTATDHVLVGITG